ncbi:MAG: Hsp20 family protein [Alphaproteobacteria bacterium]|nr:Hsp20 family protein [Alphaproteobacteria bacterium]
MRTLDLSPLFRSTVDFDRWDRVFDQAFGAEAEAQSYPPYNIEKLSESSYRIAMAVAGFTQGDIEVTQTRNSLVVRGKTKEKDEDVRYLHRGIAGRAFERQFELADHVNVTEAKLENGLLLIALQREVPEASRPRSIPIAAGDRPRLAQQEA